MREIRAIVFGLCLLGLLSACSRRSGLTDDSVSHPADHRNAVATSVYNVTAFGAVGDGQHDDTSAIQRAIDTAASDNGGIVYLPMATYLISRSLSISAGVSVRGDGYSVDPRYVGAASSPVIPSTEIKHATLLIQSSPRENIFRATTTDAVKFQGLALYYPRCETGSNASAIAINGGDGVANAQSLIRNVLIYGADRGIQLTNAVSWVVEGILFWNNLSFGLTQATTLQNSPVAGTPGSAGDWLLKGSTAQSNTSTHYAHLAFFSQGGGRIINNFLGPAGASGEGILVVPTDFIAPLNGEGTIGFNIEPLVIYSNVIRGPVNGIRFFASPTTNGISTSGVIANNWIAAPTNLRIEPGVINKKWVQGWTISGNRIEGTGAPAGYNFDIDGAGELNIHGNIVTGHPTPTRFGSNTSFIAYTDNASSGNFESPTVGIGLTTREATPPPWVGAYNVLAFGAVGDGTTDDTSAIQAAINAAQKVRGTVYLPSRKFRISSELSISGTVRITGAGYQSMGTQFTTTNSATYPVKQSHLANSSVLLQANPTKSIFSVVTTQPVEISNLEAFFLNPTRLGGNPTDTDGIYYAKPFSGASAVLVYGGAKGVNSGSLFKDLFVQGADSCIRFMNAAGFNVDNVLCYDAQTYGIVIDAAPDMAMTNAQPGTIKNSTFATGTPNYYSHVALLAGGPLNIVDNKLNGAGNCTQPGINGMSGVTVAPYRDLSAAIGDLLIAGNSLEGQKIAVALEIGNNVAARIGKVTVTGNQTWAGAPVFVTAGFPIAQWIQTLNVVNNELQSNGINAACTPTSYNLYVDGVVGALISGNLFNAVQPVTEAVHRGPNVGTWIFGGNLQTD